MAYGLGRRVEYFDQPTIRAIERDAAQDGYRMSAFVTGVVLSDAFLMQRSTEAISETSGDTPGYNN
jgi:hypothetical protein